MTQIEIMEAAIVAMTAVVNPTEEMMAAIAQIEHQIDDMMFDMVADEYDFGYYDEVIAGPDAKF